MTTFANGSPSIELFAHMLSADLAEDPKSSVRAAKIAEQIRGAIAHTRVLSRGISPVAVEADGLETALRELTANICGMFHTECFFSCPVPIRNVPREASVQLYRIAQEAVTNAIRHGHARRIEISLTHESAKLMLRIVDDGKGFQPNRRSQKGMGLRIMQYRAGVIGASLEIRALPGRGAEVTCTVSKDK